MWKLQEFKVFFLYISAEHLLEIKKKAFSKLLELKM